MKLENNVHILFQSKLKLNKQLKFLEKYDKFVRASFIFRYGNSRRIPWIMSGCTTIIQQLCYKLVTFAVVMTPFLHHGTSLIDKRFLCLYDMGGEYVKKTVTYRRTTNAFLYR